MDILILELGVISAGIIAGGIVYYIKYARSKVTDAIGNSDITSVLESVEHLATTVVYAMEQTTVGAMREAAADGKLTLSDVAIIRDKSLSTLKTMLGGTLYKSLSESVGDVTLYLQNALEEAVIDMKKDFDLNS